MTPDEIVLEKSRELLAILPDTLEQKEGNKDLFRINE
jgi:hypothetical protein